VAAARNSRSAPNGVAAPPPAALRAAAKKTPPAGGGDARGGAGGDFFGGAAANDDREVRMRASLLRPRRATPQRHDPACRPQSRRALIAAADAPVSAARTPALFSCALRSPLPCQQPRAKPAAAAPAAPVAPRAAPAAAAAAATAAPPLSPAAVDDDDAPPPLPLPPPPHARNGSAAGGADGAHDPFASLMAERAAAQALKAEAAVAAADTAAAKAKALAAAREAAAAAAAAVEAAAAEAAAADAEAAAAAAAAKPPERSEEMRAADAAVRAAHAKEHAAGAALNDAIAAALAARLSTAEAEAARMAAYGAAPAGGPPCHSLFRGHACLIAGATHEYDDQCAAGAADVASLCAVFEASGGLRLLRLPEQGEATWALAREGKLVVLAGAYAPTPCILYALAQNAQILTPEWVRDCVLNEALQPKARYELRESQAARAVPGFALADARCGLLGDPGWAASMQCVLAAADARSALHITEPRGKEWESLCRGVLVVQTGLVGHATALAAHAAGIAMVSREWLHAVLLRQGDAMALAKDYPVSVAPALWCSRDDVAPAPAAAAAAPRAQQHEHSRQAVAAGGRKRTREESEDERGEEEEEERAAGSAEAVRVRGCAPLPHNMMHARANENGTRSRALFARGRRCTRVACARTHAAPLWRASGCRRPLQAKRAEEPASGGSSGTPSGGAMDAMEEAERGALCAMQRPLAPASASHGEEEVRCDSRSRDHATLPSTCTALRASARAALSCSRDGGAPAGCALHTHTHAQWALLHVRCCAFLEARLTAIGDDAAGNAHKYKPPRYKGEKAVHVPVRARAPAAAWLLARERAHLTASASAFAPVAHECVCCPPPPVCADAGQGAVRQVPQGGWLAGKLGQGLLGARRSAVQRMQQPPGPRRPPALPAARQRHVAVSAAAAGARCRQPRRGVVAAASSHILWRRHRRPRRIEDRWPRAPARRGERRESKYHPPERMLKA
jgi:hypothetical protein